MRYAFIVIVLMALSFGGGFWWQHNVTSTVRAKLQADEAQLTADEHTISLYHLQRQLLGLVDDTANKNYGDAAALSTKFFNNLNAEVSTATDPQMKSAIQSILAQRDQVIGELAKGDPASHDLFVKMSNNFNQALQTAASQPATSTP